MTTTTPKLRHIHLPSWPWSRSRSQASPSPPRFPTYALATAVQTELQQRLLAWKAAADTRVAPPQPTLLTFTPAPTYTLGRRQTEPLSATELARLQKPLSLRYDVSGNGNGNTTGNDYDYGYNDYDYALPPTVTHAPRGGLATYHGPGQVVFWPVLDLRSPLLRAHLTVRDYACLLEKTTIGALGQTFGIRGFTTSNPGVWVGEKEEGKGSGDNRRGEGRNGERKIAALGVHLRRHVTGLGVAVNVAMPTTGPGLGPGPGSEVDEASNPWARIVACGLGGKGVTSVAAELSLRESRGVSSSSSGGRGRGGGDVSAFQNAITTAWAREFATRLGLDGVEDVLLPVDQNGQNVQNQEPQREDWERWGRELGLSSLQDAMSGYVAAERSGSSSSSSSLSSS